VRVVSLVPSATETLLALGVTPVGRTRFCDLDGVPAVGGTKDPDVEAVVALAPDLVVVNDEENRREDAGALAEAGVTLHSMSPRALDDVGAAVRALADAVRAPVPPPFAAVEWDAWLASTRRAERATAAVLIWRRPWMTVRDDTYAASVLAHLGLRNTAPAEPGETARYPETTLAALAAAAPDLVLLPDEPYPFRARHTTEVQAALPHARVVLVDGRDLFWWGARARAAVERLGQHL